VTDSFELRTLGEVATLNVLGGDDPVHIDPNSPSDCWHLGLRTASNAWSTCRRPGSVDTQKAGGSGLRPSVTRCRTESVAGPPPATEMLDAFVAAVCWADRENGPAADVLDSIVAAVY
jgi:hypothetical protein